MNSLFSQSSLKILESLTFTNTLYAFDFDGTLAPIGSEPLGTTMTPHTFDLLSKLSKCSPTAVISGRSLADLKPRVPGTVKYLIGNHGLEGLPRTTPVKTLRTLTASWKETLTRDLGPFESDLGIWIEDKEYSLALHYRRSRKKKLARAKIQEVIGRLDNKPRIIFGKLVFNVVPQEGPHKGIALKRLIGESGSGFAFYIGDDITDEDVFGLSDPRILAVRVRDQKWSQAKYYIRKQREIDRLLSLLLHFKGIEAG